QWRFDLARFGPVRLLTHPVASGIVRAISLALFLLVLSTGFFGSNDTLTNFAPTFVWIIWWVAFAYVAALIGNFWPVLSPWTIVFDEIARIARLCGLRGELHFGLSYPTWLGVWPATALFAVFAWFELIYDQAKLPQTLATFVLLYSLLTWLGMAVFGRDQWLSKGEAFSLVFEVFGRFALIGRSDRNGPEGTSNRWQLRPYASDLVTDRPCDPSMTVFVLLMLSTVTFDGFKETPQWTALLQWGALEPSLHSLRLALHDLGIDFFAAFATVVLLLFPLVFYLVYMAICFVAEEISGSDRSHQETSGLFVFSLVPIAIAYHLAHYLSYLLVSGQFIIPLVSDPFGFGWNLFGTAGFKTNIGIVGAKFVWYVAVIAIVVGHVFAVGVAHLAALRVFSTVEAALRSQYPMLLLMVGYTVVSLWIFSQPILESPSYQSFREPSGRLTMLPQASAETCLDMRAGETIEIGFKSDLPIEFNIHFHDGFSTQIPVHLKGLVDHNDRYAAELDQVHCLLWTNPTDSIATLTYDVVRP
ncbi:MAG: hypothetical protein QGH33_07050, partial [Pirellulaceae bacterium]|nr:hypothetical protein [Pirellulaceae bacterium]